MDNSQIKENHMKSGAFSRICPRCEKRNLATQDHSRAANANISENETSQLRYLYINTTNTNTITNNSNNNKSLKRIAR